MELKNSFFYLQNQNEMDGKVTYDIALNPEHFIFKAHFPGNPIVPGVCQVKMISELLEERLGKHVILEGVKNIKYLSLMTPVNQTSYSIVFNKINEEEDGCKVTVSFVDHEVQYTKLSLQYSFKA